MERIGGIRRITWGAVGLLVGIVLVFAGIRIMTDLPNITSGASLDPDAFETRYARFPWLAYAHILPGVVYLLLAPIQLWRGFRDRHIGWHRRIGRIAIVAGLVAGMFAVVFGALLSFGGLLEASASTLFGAWFVASLVVAYRSIRGGNVTAHRRWMIRAFAVGLAVGTIRLWIGVFEGFGLLSFRDAFGVAFWISFLLHATAAEAWVRARPLPSGSAPPASIRG